MSPPGKTRLLYVTVCVFRIHPQIQLVDVAVAFEASVASVDEAVDIASIRGKDDLISGITCLRDGGQGTIDLSNLDTCFARSAFICGDRQDLLSLVWDPSVPGSNEGLSFTRHYRCCNAHSSCH